VRLKLDENVTVVARDPLVEMGHDVDAGDELRLVGWLLHSSRQRSDGPQERVKLVVDDVLHDGMVGVEVVVGEVIAHAGDRAPWDVGLLFE
jgi:hypothetical protein